MYWFDDRSRVVFLLAELMCPHHYAVNQFLLPSMAYNYRFLWHLLTYLMWKEQFFSLWQTGANAMHTSLFGARHRSQFVTLLVPHISFNIMFCWLQSHVGISGNEKADKAAKSALNKPILWIPIPPIYRSQTYYQQIYSWQVTANLELTNKINSTKFIQLYLLAPLFILHINERTKSYIIDYALVTLV